MLFKVYNCLLYLLNRFDSVAIMVANLLALLLEALELALELSWPSPSGAGAAAVPFCSSLSWDRSHNSSRLSKRDKLSVLVASDFISGYFVTVLDCILM